MQCGNPVQLKNLARYSNFSPSFFNESKSLCMQLEEWQLQETLEGSNANVTQTLLSDCISNVTTEDSETW